MAKCDLCDTPGKLSTMTELLDIYQVEGVIDICPDCAIWANKLKTQLLAEVAPKVRAAIAERRGLPPAQKKPWWRIG